MAFAVQLDFEGATLDQYDEVVGKMGLEPGGATPPGALFHWVTATDDGIRVVDVWETAEQFQQFSEEKIEPFSAEAGIPGPPAVATFDVHNYFIAS